ncbi:hypothetical protein [Planctomicrobium sp. SH527]|uniref:hypothetical protein n=1 Tax=Planctomicrobium sp. SH527 TaxID=3448123 RepID=UPI003F5AF1A1
MRTRLGIVNLTIVMTSFVMMVGVRTFHPPLVHFHCHNSVECQDNVGCSVGSGPCSKQSTCQSQEESSRQTSKKKGSATQSCGHLHAHTTARHSHAHHHEHGHQHGKETDEAPANPQQDLPCHSESCLLCQFLIQAVQLLSCPVMLAGEEQVTERPVSEVIEVVTVALSGPYVRGPPLNV